MSGKKIDHQLFSAHEQALNHEPCPKCGAALQLRHGKHGPFLGCSQYPGCDFIKPLHQNDGHIIKELGVPSPECGHELVLRQGRYGMFIGCSHYPECHHIESPDTAPQEQVVETQITSQNAVKAIWLNVRIALARRFLLVMRFLSASSHSINHPWRGNAKRAVIRC